ncbi:ABC transporter substrate-binding protein [Desulfovibrio inopinatus]|uniref:ABC transporter substrate-binding protein n=1 Tax=Desulfovibrio inopinatus TaxID=102109 RepID=UPI0004065BA8|nr:ABC transporter substrate binding protein [Desulfovibrio inopinatus]
MHMMSPKHNKNLLHCFICAFFLLLLASHAQAKTWRIFILQSYNPEYIWCKTVNQGIMEALSDRTIEYDFYYLDAKRTPNAQSLQQAAHTAYARLTAFHPDIVISVDDVAAALVVKPKLTGHNAPQVIFCGINAPLSQYGFPSANVSGVCERWHYQEGFQLLKRLVPDAKRVAFLIEDSDAGAFVVNALHDELSETPPHGLTLVGVEKIKTFAQWKERIQYYQHHADALALGLYNSLVDKNGEVVAPDTIMEWTNGANTLPTLGFSDIAMNHGLLCGILESGHEQGFLAGQMVQEVMAGTPAGALPPRRNERGVVMLNLVTAHQLKISIPYRLIEAAGVVIQ